VRQPSGRDLDPIDGDLDQSLEQPLLRVARRILGSEDLARDALQEALLGLWQQDPKPENTRAWLVRAVVNRSLFMARTIRRRRKHEARACTIRPEASDREDPPGIVQTEELLRVLMEALDALPAGARAILNLHLIEELDYAAISRLLEIPVGTVRSRLSRARDALRAVLEHELAEELDDHKRLED
jgi:RNA polymerase sigma-70 factor (ECF subfamily)